MHKKFIHFFPLAGRCLPLSGKHGLSILLWKTNSITMSVPTSFSFSLTFIAEHSITWVWSIPLVSLCQLSWLCPPSSLLTPRLFAGEGKAEWEKEKALMLCKHCSAIAKTLMCYQQGFNHKSRRQHHAGCREENKLYTGQTQYNVKSSVSVHGA